MRDLARGRAATRRSISLRRSIASPLRPSASGASAASTIALGTKRGATWRRRTTLLADRDGRGEFGALDRLRLVGHRQQAGDASVFPVVRPSRRSASHQPPEIGKRQREQPPGADRRRQRRDDQHRDDANGDAGENGDRAVPETRPIVGHAVGDVEHRQEVDGRREGKHRPPPPRVQKSQRHEHQPQGAGKGLERWSPAEGTRTPQWRPGPRSASLPWKKMTDAE